MIDAQTERIEANQRQSWQDYLAGKLRVDSRPFKASIEISRNCNFRCNMCPQSWDPLYKNYHPEYNMRPELFDKIAREIFPHLSYVHLQGFGETVISPHWPRILEMCGPYAEGRRFGLVTNLSRVDDAMWRRMLEMNFVIIFSCDGATAETFERIRRRSDFKIIKHNLEVIREAKQRLGRGRLCFLVTLQKLNYRQMPQFVDMARRYGADRVTFASVMEGPGLLRHAAVNALKTLRGRRPTLSMRDIPGLLELFWGRARVWARHGTSRLTLYDLAREELAALKEETLRRGKRTGVEIRFNDAFLEDLGQAQAPSTPPAAPPALQSLGYRQGIADSGKVSLFQRCFKPYSYVVINYKGDVGLCNHLITEKGWKQMGNLSTSSFEEIWNSKAYAEMRERLLNARPDNPSCAWCFKHRMVD